MYKNSYEIFCFRNLRFQMVYLSEFRKKSTKKNLVNFSFEFQNQKQQNRCHISINPLEISPVIFSEGMKFYETSFLKITSIKKEVNKENRRKLTPSFPEPDGIN